MSTGLENTPHVSELYNQWLETAADLAVPSDTQAKLQVMLDELAAHHYPTYEHSIRVALMATKIAKVVDLPEKPMFYAGTAHDIGKCDVPVALLDKTTEWTAEDAEALRAHPLASYERMVREGLIIAAGVVVLHHTFQPNGYPTELPPDKLKLPSRLKKSIPIYGRILALADFYDASHRHDSIHALDSSQAIQDRIIGRNRDVSDLIEQLYTQGVFVTPGLSPPRNN